MPRRRQAPFSCLSGSWGTWRCRRGTSGTRVAHWQVTLAMTVAAPQVGLPHEGLAMGLASLLLSGLPGRTEPEPGWLSIPGWGAERDE
jgi:hypothetical protein